MCSGQPRPCASFLRKCSREPNCHEVGQQITRLPALESNIDGVVRSGLLGHRKLFYRFCGVRKRCDDSENLSRGASACATVQDKMTGVEMKKAAIILLLFPFMLLPYAHAAEINAIGEYCSGPCAYLKGEIKSGDLIKLKVVFESPTRRRVFIPDFKPPTEIFELQLNSRGGSLEEAMEIGRWVRKNKIHTRMPSNSECFSSCVYIFAAGVSRVSFSFWAQKVGIHRPYLTQLPKEGVQVAMRKALADSRAYFAEMNVPERLAAIVNLKLGAR